MENENVFGGLKMEMVFAKTRYERLKNDQNWRKIFSRFEENKIKFKNVF